MKGFLAPCAAARGLLVPGGVWPLADSIWALGLDGFLMWRVVVAHMLIQRAECCTVCQAWFGSSAPDGGANMSLMGHGR